MKDVNQLGDSKGPKDNRLNNVINEARLQNRVLRKILKLNTEQNLKARDISKPLSNPKS